MAQREDNHPRGILKAKLDVLSLQSSTSFIFRAPPELRQVNERAYEPQIISIGPYHHGRDHLRAMEEHKARYLYNILQWRRDMESDDLESYIATSMSMEEKVRDCYADTFEMEPADFVAMMVLDGLFVVELIRKFTNDELREKNDALLKQNSNLSTIMQDLLLLENQLPFFVLAKFADMTGLDEQLFANKTLRFFSGMVQGNPYEHYPIIQRDRHLLGVIYDNWFPTLRFRLLKIPRHRKQYLLHHKYGEEPNNKPQVVTGEWNVIRSATELLEAGIRFNKSGGNCLFEIEFEKGKFYIPTLIVNRNTERMLRNLIAYEQFNQGFSIAMDYARLMNCLISDANDVALLSDCGIIYNLLGSNEDAANMFNKLNDYVFLSSSNFYYSDVFDNVNEHCRRPWNSWKLKLKQNYFHTSWDWVFNSILVGIILLLLSLVQTICSVISSFK